MNEPRLSVPSGPLTSTPNSFSLRNRGIPFSLREGLGEVILACQTSFINRYMIDKTVIRKGKLKDQSNDFLFWQSQPYLKRLAVMEEIRQDFNTWKYGAEQRFQRVYRILKLK